MPSEKRRRKKEGHRARLEAARLAARRRQRRRQAIAGGTFVAVLFLVFVAVSTFGHEDKKGAVAGPDPTAAPYGKGECAPATKPTPTPTNFTDAPRNCLKPGTTYRAVITTTEGVVKVDVDTSSSPVAANNFVNLARWGWFDGEGFHRVVPGFVDQAGNAAGRGNPGYSIKDELPASLDAYPKGTLAMANAGPDTGGSQWFICVDCSKLPKPAYAVFGHVTDGLGVVDAINALGTGDGPPSKPVTITSVEITEG